jgi:hypothetical protein
MDDKSYRQAEARALRNGIESDTPRSDSWGYRPEPLPLGDVPSNGKVRSKRERKPKEKCPVNRVHEWYREEVEQETWHYPFWGERKPYTTLDRYKVKTCIHCWKEVKTKIWVRGSYRASFRGRLVIPKRPVKF